MPSKGKLRAAKPDMKKQKPELAVNGLLDESDSQQFLLSITLLCRIKGLLGKSCLAAGALSD